MRSDKRYLEHGYDEEILCRIVSENFNNKDWVHSVKCYMKDPNLNVTRAHCHCIQTYDWFFHEGLNGRHFCMTFEVLGKNLLSLIKRYNFSGIPIPIVREITK